MLGRFQVTDLQAWLAREEWFGVFERAQLASGVSNVSGQRCCALGNLEDVQRSAQRRLPAWLPGRNGRVSRTRRPAAVRRLHRPGSPLQNA